jgi:hypothetical protein
MNIIKSILIVSILQLYRARFVMGGESEKKSSSLLPPNNVYYSSGGYRQSWYDRGILYGGGSSEWQSIIKHILLLSVQVLHLRSDGRI